MFAARWQNELQWWTWAHGGEYFHAVL